MKVLAVFSLPPELKHLERDANVQAKVFSAMEHKRNDWGDFDVKIGEYTVGFTQDDGKTGFLSHGPHAGYYQVAYRSYIVDVLNEVQLAELTRNLRRFEQELNAAICPPNAGVN